MTFGYQFVDRVHFTHHSGGDNYLENEQNRRFQLMLHKIDVFVCDGKIALLNVLVPGPAKSPSSPSLSKSKSTLT